MLGALGMLIGHRARWKLNWRAWCVEDSVGVGVGGGSDSFIITFPSNLYIKYIWFSFQAYSYVYFIPMSFSW